MSSKGVREQTVEENFMALREPFKPHGKET